MCTYILTYIMNIRHLLLLMIKIKINKLEDKALLIQKDKRIIRIIIKTIFKLPSLYGKLFFLENTPPVFPQKILFSLIFIMDYDLKFELFSLYQLLSVQNVPKYKDRRGRHDSCYSHWLSCKYLALNRFVFVFVLFIFFFFYTTCELFFPTTRRFELYRLTDGSAAIAAARIPLRTQVGRYYRTPAPSAPVLRAHHWNYTQSDACAANRNEKLT